MNTTKTDHTTVRRTEQRTEPHCVQALCVVPVCDEDTQQLLVSVQEFRKAHDKAYERWPPHINIVS